ncbi:flagellar biosynthetic protein FliR [Pseudooceanicola onchidii]|uniref:flagellar biosynthetic protein FliR n=1 Tax=Pseudooceanicola onchidii TaxID=2562279 RepID=UPI0010A99D08|nr:flagellar biosynthetic protein FliR [Pseudooceanicola onchidii]
MTAAAELMTLAQTGLWQALLVFLRVGALMALLPGFSEEVVPVRIKLGLAVALTVVTIPAVPEMPLEKAWEFWVFLRFLATETIAGLALGIALRLMILALQTAGSMAAQSSSLSQIAGGAAAEPLPAMGHILVIGALALLMMMGLHVRTVEFLIESYRVLPAGHFPSPSDLTEWGIAGVSRAFALAFTLAAPFVIVSVIYNLTLGVINRAMPQLMVAFVGAPVITFGGLALLFLLAPTMLVVWRDTFMSVLANPFGAVP